MSTINTPTRPAGETTGTARRPKQHLAEDAMRYDLEEESTALLVEARTVSDGRAAKTLAKHTGLNTAMTALRRGTVIRQHQTPAPVIVQVISGTVRVTLPSGPVEMHSGEMLALDENVTHEVEALSDASILLAVAAHPPVAQD